MIVGPRWMFGTVLANLNATIMLIGISDGNCRTTNKFQQTVPAGGWYGITILPHEDKDGPYGETGDITWVLEPKSEWTVLDDRP